MNELATVHCRNTYSSHISPKMRGFYIPCPGKAESVYLGIMAHEQKGADSWETRSRDCSHVYKDPVGIIRNSQNNLKDRGEGVKIDKGAHQEKDGFHGSGLGGGGGSSYMLDPLLVPVQDENHGAAGPEHEPQAEHIRE